MAEHGTVPTPGVADGHEHALDPASVQAARIVGGVSAAILSALGLIAAVIVVVSVGGGALTVFPAFGVWGLLTALLATNALVWPALRYRYTSYRVDPQGLRIRRGVLWRSEISIPRSRVQHTDVSRGPVERGFDLATLIVHTAGTENASISLGGLRMARAHAIRDYLIEEGGDDAV